MRTCSCSNDVDIQWLNWVHANAHHKYYSLSKLQSQGKHRVKVHIAVRWPWQLCMLSEAICCHAASIPLAEQAPSVHALNQVKT